MPTYNLSLNFEYNFVENVRRGCNLVITAKPDNIISKIFNNGAYVQDFDIINNFSEENIELHSRMTFDKRIILSKDLVIEAFIEKKEFCIHLINSDIFIDIPVSVLEYVFNINSGDFTNHSKNSVLNKHPKFMIPFNDNLKKMNLGSISYFLSKDIVNLL